MGPESLEVLEVRGWNISHWADFGVRDHLFFAIRCLGDGGKNNAYIAWSPQGLSGEEGSREVNGPETSTVQIPLSF